MTHQQVTTDEEALATVRKLIKGIDVAMLTTVSAQGLVSRPMQTQAVEFDGDLWFITMKDTDKYDELKQNPHVNVNYVGKSYVSIRGTAEIVNDRAKIAQFWNAAYEKMLQTTNDDPNLILIKVHAETAEYWEMGNIRKLVKQLFHTITGDKEDNAHLNEVVHLEKNN
ncbi:pyridoxamine 5'-phosphate oxidase family protein [Paenibacillus yanchengensis]|uniref:Pyridoxamine 5'-phosphate oxidase family protein n=1 Tax=Paenibacillus yanchengensis TaxID=2035833 RepID=A0ABW4YNT0_9BACL